MLRFIYKVISICPCYMYHVSTQGLDTGRLVSSSIMTAYVILSLFNHVNVLNSSIWWRLINIDGQEPSTTIPQSIVSTQRSSKPNKWIK
jgi:hypothetical protein